MRTILHLSDLHFGGIAPGTATAMIRHIAQNPPNLVVVSGDLTLAGKVGEFVEARAFLDRIGAPTLVVPGNHDIPAYAIVERFVRPLARYRRHITPNLAPEFVDEEMVVLGLNTARPWDLSWNWSHGRFSRRQVRRAARVYEAHAGVALKCLVMHHPFIVPDNLPGFRRVGRAEAMLGVLARHGVDLVLSGHLHHGFWHCQEINVEPNGRQVLVIQASTATSTRRRHQPNAFNHLAIDGHSLVLTPHEWSDEAGGFVPAQASRFVRDAAGWSPVAGPAVVETEEERVVAVEAAAENA